MKTIWKNGRFLTMKAGTYSPLLNGSLVSEGGNILWLGESADCPDFPDAQVVDLQQAWVTPGFVDCHTHLVFGSERSKEFEMRLQGKPMQKLPLRVVASSARLLQPERSMKRPCMRKR
jgi:imidazolonepropionase